MKKIYFNLIKFGDWGLGIGDWGFGVWGFGYWPQTPIPNPQSPIPNPHNNKIFFILLYIYILYEKILIIILNFLFNIK